MDIAKVVGLNNLKTFYAELKKKFAPKQLDSIVDETGNPVLDSNGNPQYYEYITTKNGYTAEQIDNRLSDISLPEGSHYLRSDTGTKGYTQEEVNKMIEKRLAREKAKAEQERLEAEELAKLSEAERQKKLFEKQVAEFEAERAEWQASRLKEETRNQLRERNILSDFDEFVIGSDAEATLDKLNRFETLLNRAVELAVNERLKGKAPKTSASGSSGEMTKEQFRKLNIVEKQALLASNPTLFTELNK